MEKVKVNLFIMKTTKISILALFITLLISSCQHAPNANDKEVKEKAIENAIKMIYSNSTYFQRSILIRSMRGDKKASKDLDNKWLEDFTNGLAAFGKNNSEELKSVIDSSLKIGNIRIDNIRIDNTNNELKKSECSADLYFGLLFYNISYMAQYTEDGILVVETQFK